MAEGNYTLDSVRDVLVREEDIIIFGLIERAKFPLNFNAYNKNYFNIPSFALTLLHFVAIDTEALQAKGGRYGNPEENPFFPEKLPPSFVTPYPFTKFLHAGGASININKSIWKFYLDEFLSKWFDVLGDDGNYAQTAASDFSLLQDKKGIEKLLTDTSVEEKVIKRVEEKARVYGMYVTLNKGNKNGTKYKVDPLVVSTLYKKWLIPLTKSVEVEYLLHRLD
ncbi:hypothetical protein TanjilG_15733 [Lupinus angustifolius]|uniref:chorismate mutase n=1 Tax=Lupinus angustifolius TaxID=3871 RepID=A0A1J7INP6_LUPAN|nr:hypothetical protein TanjilG_15733 [Lupinus angustifolius]